MSRSSGPPPPRRRPRPLALSCRCTEGRPAPARFQVGVPPAGGPKVLAPRGDVHAGPSGPNAPRPRWVSRRGRPGPSDRKRLDPGNNAMMEVIRVVLVDPADQVAAGTATAARRDQGRLDRRGLRDLPGGGPSRRRDRARPDDRGGRLEHRAGRRPDPGDRPGEAGRGRAPRRARSAKRSVILQLFRAGAREFLEPPGRGEGTEGDVRAALRGPHQAGAVGRPRPSGHRPHGDDGGGGLHDAGRQRRGLPGQGVRARGRPGRLRPLARIGRLLARRHVQTDPPGGRPGRRRAST